MEEAALCEVAVGLLGGTYVSDFYSTLVGVSPAPRGCFTTDLTDNIWYFNPNAASPVECSGGKCLCCCKEPCPFITGSPMGASGSGTGSGSAGGSAGGSADGSAGGSAGGSDGVLPTAWPRAASTPAAPTASPSAAPTEHDSASMPTGHAVVTVLAALFFLVMAGVCLKYFFATIVRKGEEEKRRKDQAQKQAARADEDVGVGQFGGAVDPTERPCVDQTAVDSEADYREFSALPVDGAERRIAPDGQAYTNQEFITYFESDWRQQWDAAKPAGARGFPKDGASSGHSTGYAHLGWRGRLQDTEQQRIAAAATAARGRGRGRGAAAPTDARWVPFIPNATQRQQRIYNAWGKAHHGMWDRPVLWAKAQQFYKLNKDNTAELDKWDPLTAPTDQSLRDDPLPRFPSGSSAVSPHSTVSSGGP